MQAIRGIIPILGLAAAGLVGLIGTARAQVQNADVGINQSYTQTSDSTPVSDGGFFSARVFFTNPGDYTTGTLTLPSTATRTLIDQGYTPDLEIGYEDVGTLAYLNSTYGPGTYGYAVGGGTQPATAFSITYAGDAYPNLPLVTNLSALQGADAADPITLDLNGMSVSPNATPGVNNIYLDIYTSVGGNLAYYSGALATDTTDIVIPADTLSEGVSYYFDLVYDDRIVGTTGGDSPITLTQFYDIGTTGDFTTAVPEPSTWAMMLLGFAGLGYASYRRSHRPRTIAV
jgi:PEP-CTERM motif